MNAGGCQRDNHISCLHSLIIQNLRLVYNAGAIAGQVIILCGHHTGMLSRFAANESTASTDTALCNTAYNLGNFFRIVLAAGNIVQEKQGFCTAADNIIGAHSNAVNADGIVLVHQHSNFQFCANAIGAGNQNRLGNTGQIQTETATEAAHIIQTAFIFCSGNMLFH